MHRKKSPIALIAAAGVGILVIIAGVTVTAIQLWPATKGEGGGATADGGKGGTDARSKPAKARTELNTEQIFDKTARSVVFIKGKLERGSGFLVLPNIIATNAHVVNLEIARNLEVEFPTASGEDKGPFTPELVYEDITRDLAFLSVPSKLPPLDVAETFEFHPGMPITIIGSPGIGSDVVKNAVSTGNVSQKGRFFEQEFYQLGASVNPGNSGGPIFNKFGEVIGVATLKLNNKEQMSFCIPVEDLRSAIGRVKSQSPETAAEASARHRLRVVCRYVVILGRNFADGTLIYSAAMNEAIRQGKPPNDALIQAANQIDSKLRRLDDLFQAFKLRDEMGELQANKVVDAPAREQVFALYDTFQQMKGLLDRPQTAGGTVQGFVDAATKLRAALDRQVGVLESRLGLSDESEFVRPPFYPWLSP